VKLKLEELLPLVSSRTRIVAITACSNILGSIVPVKEVVKAVRAEAKAQGAPKVEISVDCVAYAPHRLIDVQDWDVDFAAFSFYKVCLAAPRSTCRDLALMQLFIRAHQVYGPHISGMYVRSTALEHSVSPIVHHFLKVDKVAYKLQPGGPGYEAVYGTTGVVPYLLSLTPQNDLKASFDAIAQHEQTLLQPLIDFLVAPAQRERGVRIVGEETVNLDRVPTVSFVVVGQQPLKSRAIVEYFDAKGGVSDSALLLSIYLFLYQRHWLGAGRNSLWPFLCVHHGRPTVAKDRHRRGCGSHLARTLQYGGRSGEDH
jgi:selenocysteine lyase/cysteine desulfurase